MYNQITFICNNEVVNTSVHPGTTLLDFLRNNLKLTGTKEGCREGDCGACTVLIGEYSKRKVNYKSINSCLFPIAYASDKHVVTIEGLNNTKLSPVQNAFVEKGGTQCGFCTPGFIVSLTGYLLSANNFNSDEIIYSMEGNICRCTGHIGIKKSAEEVYNFLRKKRFPNEKDIIVRLIKFNFIPEYFKTIPQRLKKIIDKNKIKRNGVSKSKIFIGGGTDLYVQKWDELTGNNLVFLNLDQERGEIKKTGNEVEIAGQTTVTEFINSPIVQKFIPSIKEFLKLFGSLPIRNSATIAGNIVNASPIADITNILLSLDASLILSSGKKERKIELKKFYKGYKLLNKRSNEIIGLIKFTIPAKNSFFNFEKVSKRQFLDIASVNTSIYFESKNNFITKMNLSAGGVAPTPLYLSKTCKFLTGKVINYSNIEAATEIAVEEIFPISDARGSAEYKTLLLRQLIFAHFYKFDQEVFETGQVI